MSAGRILHLCGGMAPLQRQVLLGFCKGTRDRGETSVYFDIDFALSPQDIERAVLLGSFNPADPGDPSAPFRVLSPQTPAELDDQLKALTRLSPAPSVVVVGGLQHALANRFGKRSQNAGNVAKAGRVVHALIQKYRVLCADANMTLVLAHSPDAAIAGNQKVKPTPLERTTRGTMFAHCGFGLEFGEAWPDDADANHQQVAVKLWNLNTQLGRAVTLRLCGKGRFAN